MDKDRLVTSHEGPELLRADLGIPFKRSRLLKDSALGLAPKPAAIFGKTYLWRYSDLREYALSLLKQPTCDEWELIGKAADRVVEKLNNEE